MLQMSQKVGYILIPAVTKGESHASIQINSVPAGEVASMDIIM